MKTLLLIGIAICVCLSLGVTGPLAGDARSLDLKPLFSVSESATGQAFRNPQGIGFDPVRGEIYVADTGRSQIVVFSRTGVPIARFQHWVRDSNEQRVPGEPSAVLPRAGGELLVSDALSDQVDVLDLRGMPTRSINVTAALGRGTRASPGKMDSDQEGNLYLVERSSGQVLVFDRDGHFVRSFGRRGKGEGRFEMIADVAVCADGSAYVLDSVGTPVVQAFDGKGQFFRGFGRHSNKPEDFHFPIALTFDADGHLWVADAFSHEVKAYRVSGEFLGSSGDMGTGTGQFFFPSDVVASPDGTLYVVEKAGRRLQAFQIIRPRTAGEEVISRPAD